MYWNKIMNPKQHNTFTSVTWYIVYVKEKNREICISPCNLDCNKWYKIISVVMYEIMFFFHETLLFNNISEGCEMGFNLLSTSLKICYPNSKWSNCIKIEAYSWCFLQFWSIIWETNKSLYHSKQTIGTKFLNDI